jgi:steroid 5-alpha reductase family enzyme
VIGSVELGRLAITSVALWVAFSAIMAGAWLVWRRTRNSGWVDVTWSFGVGAISVVACLVPLHTDASHWRQIAVAALSAAWCLRLGFHIARRTRATTDDPRYRALIEQWGSYASRRLFWFVQAQAAVGVVLILSMSLAAQNSNPALRWQDYAGVALLVCAVTGEAIADHQLLLFKGANPGKICNVGLWRWSRHPNYFFEWLTWLAAPILAIDVAYNPYGFLALAAPICMYWVLVHQSGIPPLEAHMARTRGAAFSRYQNKTSAFFPLPPR